MNDDPDRLVTRAELSLQWAAGHGVRYDEDGKSFDEVARDYYQAAANIAYARALLIEAAVERRGGHLDPCVDPVHVRDPNGEGGTDLSPGRRRRGPLAPARSPDHAHGVQAVTEPMLQPPDVPLIVEELLAQAQHLADTGAPREAIDALLDHVDAIREGRGR